MNLTPYPVLLLAALFPIVIQAAPDLGEVLEASVARDPDRNLAAAIETESRALRHQAGSLLAGDPALSVRHETDAIDNDRGYRYWEGGLALPLWLPGQRADRREVASATAEEAAAQAWLHRWQVAGVVRELVWSLRIAEAEKRLAQQALASARALQDDVERRLRAGELAHADLILAQKETLARELEHTQAEFRHQALRARYRSMTGLGELPPLAEEAPAPAAGIDRRHPALAAATAATARARAERDRVRNEKRDNPLLTVGAIKQRPEQRFDYEQSLVLELSVPLGLASQAAPRTAVAERDLTEASTALMRLRRQLERDLIEASAERSRTEQTVRFADTRQRLAAEGLRLSRRAFELGEGDLFSLLQARSQAIAAEREWELQQLEHGRAVARHNQALGVLPQ